MAVVDIRMPPTFTDEGLRAAIELRRQHPGLGILLFSQYIETRYAAELLADDAAGIGYLLKDRVADVERLRRGPRAGGLGRHRPRPRGGDPAHGGVPAHATRISMLSAREREVLSLMAEGRTNAAIAAALVISEGRGGEARGQHLHQARPAASRSPITAGCWPCCATSTPETGNGVSGSVQRVQGSGTRTRVRSISSTVAAPASRMVRSMSWRSSVSTRSTPVRPAAASP